MSERRCHACPLLLNWQAGLPAGRLYRVRVVFGCRAGCVRSQPASTRRPRPLRGRSTRCETASSSEKARRGARGESTL
eukprot:6198472-Pleurochrysis_carterae.AAC.5